METEKKNNFVAILSKLIILALVVIAFGFLFFRTDGFTTTKSFYLKCDENKFISDTNNFDILLNKEYKFEIVSEKDKVLHKDSKYFVSVIPNITQSSTFSFKVDGENVKFDEVKSLSKGFIIKAYEDYFTLKAFEDLPDILKSIYPGKEVSDCPSALDSGIPYFKLVVSNENNESVCVNFNLKHNVVIVNLIDNSDETVGKNHIRFSNNQIELSNEKPSETFEIVTDNEYYFDYSFENDGLFTLEFDYTDESKVVCKLKLKDNYYIQRECKVEICFKAYPSQIILSPKDTTQDLTQFGHIKFSVENVILTNSQRTASFQFTIDDNFALVKNDISTQIYTVKIEDSLCTVTLNENYTVKDLQKFDLPFQVYFVGSDSILFVNVTDKSDEIVGIGHITFNADNLLLTNSDRNTMFNFSLEKGYVIQDCLYDNSICEITIEDNVCKIQLKNDFSITENMQFEITFKIGYENGYTVVVSPIDDTYDMTSSNDVTFSVKNLILTNTERTGSFEFTIPQGYVLLSIEYDQSILSVSIENNICNVSLQSNIVENIAIDLKFTIEPSLVLSPVDHRDEGHITFSVDDVILTNTQRSATFDFTIEEGYILDDYSYLSDGLFTMTISGNTCTVTLLDGVSLTEIGQYNLLFTVGAYE